MDIYIKLKYGVNTPADAYWYCQDNGRTPQLEGLVLTSPEYAFWYARDIICGRWGKGEDIISTSSEYAYLYARYVIEGRWERGEKIIVDSEYNKAYQEFINGHVPKIKIRV